ncbi:hypothetical protein DBV14_24020 [Variovorax sp. KBW07]|nr:hypothetical protein DBV14_24020 [Variovorax sp. KBW07]
MQVDAADRSVTSNSYVSKTIFVPAIVPPTPPSSLAVGNIVKETSACGPLQHVVKRPVAGTFIGLFSESKVDQGYTDELESYVGPNGEVEEYMQRPAPGGGYVLLGHQVSMYTAIIGVSGARNLALGGGGSQGSWGQGGTGTSSANQQLVTTIQLRLCEVGRYVPERVAMKAPPLPIIERPAE